MKKYFRIVAGVCLLSVVVLLGSCKTEVHHCTGCCEYNAATLDVVLDSISGEKASLQFYKAFTPANTDYCEYYNAADQDGGYIWIEDKESCRENPDKKYSDSINTKFLIGGYSASTFSAKGFRTKLKIRKPSDTTAIWENDVNRNYGEGGDVFIGEDRVRDIGGGIGVAYPFASGLYAYTFYVYDTVFHSVYGIPDGKKLHPSDSEMLVIMDDQFLFQQYEVDMQNGLYLDPGVDSVVIDEDIEEVVVDTVAGFFCLIRNEVDCPVSGCSGADDGDPLLK